MSATFVLSTGRCGTQWLTKKLVAMYPDRIICHEPLSFDYRPDLNTEAEPLHCNQELLLQHLSEIQRHLNEGQHYIETGFPCWRHLSWFRQHLKGRVRVVHLHREPLQTVHSLLKINAFVPPFLPHLPLKNLYLPSPDTGYLKQWQHLWPQLNPAEKNLWYWAEVQAQALQLRAGWQADNWLELSFSQLFSARAEQRLVDFFGEPVSRELNVSEPVDIYGVGALVTCPVEFPLLEQIAAIPELARQLGYGL
jgi:hypothetical protein